MDILGSVEKALKTASKTSIDSKYLSKDIVTQIKDKLKSYLETSYYLQSSKIYQSLGYNPMLDSSDKLIVDNVLNSKILWDSYANLEGDITKEINIIIRSNFKDFALDIKSARADIIKFIPKITENRANTILRTENDNIRTLASQNTFNKLDPNSEFRYRWIGPNDYRTADSSKRVKSRTSQGVSMEDLKQIIKQEADQRTYTSERPYIVHINQRHSYIKV